MRIVLRCSFSEVLSICPASAHWSRDSRCERSIPAQGEGGLFEMMAATY